MAIRDDNFILTLQDLKKANKNLLIVNITNEIVIPTKTAELAIKRKYIRGYIADLKTIKNVNQSQNGSILIPKAGYFTDEAKVNKKHILQMMLKKYSAEAGMTKNHIYIVRHGGTEWNEKRLYQGTLDSNLTAEGRQHALDIAEFLKDKKINKIYTSPLGRAVKTASIISKRINASVEIIPEFHEINFGIFQGKNKDKMKETFLNYYKERSENKYIKLYRPYPDGESYYEVYLRVLPRMLRLVATEDNFVVIGHESINRILRAVVNEEKPEESVNKRQNSSTIVSYNFTTNLEEEYII